MSRKQEPIKPKATRKPGGGRKPNTGKYEEPTKPIRVPIRLIDKIIEFIKTNLKTLT